MGGFVEQLVRLSLASIILYGGNAQDCCAHDSYLHKKVYRSLESPRYLTVHISACDGCCPSANQHITQAWISHPYTDIHYDGNLMWFDFSKQQNLTGGTHHYNVRYNYTCSSVSVGVCTSTDSPCACQQVIELELQIADFHLQWDHSEVDSIAVLTCVSGLEDSHDIQVYFNFTSAHHKTRRLGTCAANQTAVVQEKNWTIYRESHLPHDCVLNVINATSTDVGKYQCVGLLPSDASGQYLFVLSNEVDVEWPSNGTQEVHVKHHKINFVLYFPFFLSVELVKKFKVYYIVPLFVIPLVLSCVLMCLCGKCKKPQPREGEREPLLNEERNQGQRDRRDTGVSRSGEGGGEGGEEGEEGERQRGESQGEGREQVIESGRHEGIPPGGTVKAEIEDERPPRVLMSPEFSSQAYLGSSTECVMTDDAATEQDTLVEGSSDDEKTREETRPRRHMQPISRFHKPVSPLLSTQRHMGQGIGENSEAVSLSGHYTGEKSSDGIESMTASQRLRSLSDTSETSSEVPPEEYKYTTLKFTISSGPSSSSSPDSRATSGSISPKERHNTGANIGANSTDSSRPGSPRGPEKHNNYTGEKSTASSGSLSPREHSSPADSRANSRDSSRPGSPKGPEKHNYTGEKSTASSGSLSPKEHRSPGADSTANSRESNRPGSPRGSEKPNNYTGEKSTASSGSLSPKEHRSPADSEANSRDSSRPGSPRGHEKHNYTGEKSTASSESLSPKKHRSPADSGANSRDSSRPGSPRGHEKHNYTGEKSTASSESLSPKKHLSPADSGENSRDSSRAASPRARHNTEPESRDSTRPVSPKGADSRDSSRSVSPRGRRDTGVSSRDSSRPESPRDGSSPITRRSSDGSSSSRTGPSDSGKYESQT